MRLVCKNACFERGAAKSASKGNLAERMGSLAKGVPVFLALGFFCSSLVVLVAMAAVELRPTPPAAVARSAARVVLEADCMETVVPGWVSPPLKHQGRRGIVGDTIEVET